MACPQKNAMSAYDRLNSGYDKAIDKGFDKIEDGVEKLRNKAEGTMFEGVVHGLTVGKLQKEVSTMVNDMFTQQSLINEMAVRLRDDLSTLKTEESTQLTRALSGDIKPEEITAPHMREIYTKLRAAIDANTDKLIEMGALAESYRLENYLKRFYEKYTEDNNKWLNSIGIKMDGHGRKVVERTTSDAEKLHQELSTYLDGNGHQPLELASMDDLIAKIQERNLIGRPSEGKVELVRHEDGSVTMRRGLTLDERVANGLIEDASYAIPMTIVDQRKQLTRAALLKKIADDYGVDGKVDGYVLIPATEMGKGSGIYEYGALAGKYVSKEVWNALSDARMIDSGVKGFLETKIFPLVDHIKVNLTVKNPFTHIYNTGSNMYLAYLHGHLLSIGRVLDMAVRDNAKFSALLKEASEMGLGSQLLELESGMKKLEGSKDSTMMKIWKLIYMTEDSVTGSAVRTAYEWEDKIFKLAAYYDKVRELDKKGIVPTEAQKRKLLDEAQAEYVDYRTPMPPALRFLDKSGLFPFLHYQVKSLPQVAKAIAKHPVRYLILQAALLAFGGSAFTNDEDEARTPYYAGDTVNLWGAANYVRLGDTDWYWNQGRMLPGPKLGITNFAIPNQHGEMNFSGGFYGGVLRIMSGEDTMGRSLHEDGSWKDMALKRTEEVLKSFAPSMTIGRYAQQLTRAGVAAATGDDDIAPKSSYKESIVDPNTGKKKTQGVPLTAPEIVARAMGVKRFKGEEEMSKKALDIRKQLKKRVANGENYTEVKADLIDDNKELFDAAAKDGVAIDIDNNRRKSGINIAPRINILRD